MFKKIIVPLDGSDSSQRILGWAGGLAKCLDAEMVLLAIVDPDEVQLPESTPSAPHPMFGKAPYDSPGPYTAQVVSAGASGVIGISGTAGTVERPPAYGTQIIDRAVQVAEDYLNSQAREYEDQGVRVSTKVVVGQPAEEIVNHARKTGADMIAMATRRESALARGVLGSVTDRVLHSTDIPVLTIHPENTSNFEGNAGAPNVVIIPLDASELSEKAIEPGLEIAEAAGSEVVFLSSIRFPFYGVTGPELDYYSGEYGVTEQRQEALEHLSQFVKRARERGIKARAHAVMGAPTNRITEEANANKGALIVMSTHGAGGLKRWVIGSVTDKVVRSSGQPVLVIPPKTGE